MTERGAGLGDAVAAASVGRGVGESVTAVAGVGETTAPSAPADWAGAGAVGWSVGDAPPRPKAPPTTIATSASGTATAASCGRPKASSGRTTTEPSSRSRLPVPGISGFSRPGGRSGAETGPPGVRSVVGGEPAAGAAATTNWSVRGWPLITRSRARAATSCVAVLPGLTVTAGGTTDRSSRSSGSAAAASTTSAALPVFSTTSRWRARRRRSEARLERGTIRAASSAKGRTVRSPSST